MNAEGFKNWLLASGQKKSAAENRVANCATVEREQHVDLDVCYTKDRCERLIDLLTYSREDARRNRPPRHSIPINGDAYNGTATYKSAVKKYVAFKDAGGMVRGKPISPKKVPPKVESKSTMSDAVKDRINIDDEFRKVLQRFRKWLIEEAGLKSNSAGQYKTYIKKIRSVVDGQFGLAWFESLLPEYLKDLSEDKLIQCSAFIEDSIRKTPKSGRKAWNDWRSAFHRFEEFLHDIADVYNCDAETLGKELAKEPTAQKRKIKPAKPAPEKEDAKNDAVIATYTHQELARAFMGRLKTQSRYYPKFGLLFPTRLLTKIFKHSKRNIWIEWLKSDLKDMLILAKVFELPIAKGGLLKISFSNVKQFEFHGDGTVLITKSDGATVIMMTHTADGKNIMIEKAKRGLRDVSIDHVKSLEGVLRRNKNRLSGLRRITELFFEFEKSVCRKLNPRAEKDWVNDFYRQYRHILDSDEMRALVASDLNLLELEYELMDTRENSIKGNGV